MCFIGSESSFDVGGGGGGTLPRGEIFRPQPLSVPTSPLAVSCTVSVHWPVAFSPAKAERSNAPLMSSAEPPCLLETTALLPEGLVSVTTRSPR